ncbi:hypothetical protein OAV85_00610 [Candidatus Nanopelagicales bacterium]|nr:hypothetical protein [Candidatus Nanopelagicales bacterium]
MPSSVVVVTPVWRPGLSDDELIRLRITERASQSWQRVILHPEGMPIETIQQQLPSWTYQSCEPHRLSSVQSYSSWLLQSDFYERFRAFEFMLIAQLDSVLLRQPPSSAFDYDFLGAPWDPPWRVTIVGGQMRIIRAFGRMWGKKLIVGNGGLSIRRTTKFTEAAEGLAHACAPGVRETANEDAVWAYFADELGLKLAPEHQASIFVDMRDDQVPNLDSVVGVHGLRHTTPRANEAIQARLR